MRPLTKFPMMNRSLTIKKAASTGVTAVAATGFKGEPSERQLQGASVSFPVDRPLSLVGYTGGWTMGGNPASTPPISTPFGNTK